MQNWLYFRQVVCSKNAWLFSLLITTFPAAMNAEKLEELQMQVGHHKYHFHRLFQSSTFTTMNAEKLKKLQALVGQLEQ